MSRYRPIPRSERPAHWSHTDHAIADLLEKGVPMATIREGLRIAAEKLAKQIANGTFPKGPDQ